MPDVFDIPAVEPRALFDDDEPNGYLESLDDWVDHNKSAVEWFLENRDGLVKAIAALRNQRPLRGR